LQKDGAKTLVAKMEPKSYKLKSVPRFFTMTSLKYAQQDKTVLEIVQYLAQLLARL